jgi:diaminopimelate epimerase
MVDFSAYSGLTFRKMHGAGNDFVVLDQRGGTMVIPVELARALGDRNRGVGFDQLAILSGAPGSYRLAFMNPDGSTAGACGNATRCVADWLMAQTGQPTLTVTTERGDLLAQREASGQVWVNMGQPMLDWQDVPLARSADTASLPLAGSPMALSMGNPHCVFFVDDADATDPAHRGSLVERDPLFPEGANVEFASLIAPDHLRMRVWERGAGITLACGSGACAVAVAAATRGLTGRRVTLNVDGGTLGVDWRDDGVWLTGPTAYVFDGVLTDAFLDSL